MANRVSDSNIFCFTFSLQASELGRFNVGVRPAESEILAWDIDGLMGKACLKAAEQLGMED